VCRSKETRPGLGSNLAIDALRRALNVAGEVGVKPIVQDVIDDGGNAAFMGRREFYRSRGFLNFQDSQERMFITIDTIRAMFGNE
jgi:hypothetical protein